LTQPIPELVNPANLVNPLLPQRRVGLLRLAPLALAGAGAPPLRV